MFNTMFILFICVHLTVLSNAVVRSELKCKKIPVKKIFLINTASSELVNTDIHGFEQSAFYAVNAKLIEMCGNFYNFEFSSFEMGIHETAEAINTQINVVNLWGRNYYDYYPNINKTLVYAGDIIYQPVTSTDVSFNTKQDSDSCSNSKDQGNEKRIAKIVSNAVANIEGGDLVDFISSIQYENNAVTSRLSCMKQATKTTDLKIVLICSDSWQSCLRDQTVYASKLKFKTKPESECSEFTKIYQNNILAVLAPKPFEMEYETLIPMIFYDSAHMHPKHKSLFPNSMNLVSSQFLTKVFMRFINDAGWWRVAIISDNTPFSTDFETGILDLFHKKQMMYNVHRCTTADDFQKAITYLVKVDARIIIANVDGKNAEKLATLIAPYKNRFIILFRVSPFWDWIDSQFQNWISITMGPSVTNFPNCLYYQDTICSEIMLGLRIVADARAKYLNSENLHRTTFYRKFAQTMATMVPSDSVAYIKRMNEDLFKLHLSSTGAITTVIKYKDPFNKKVPDQKACIAKVNNFSKPCDQALYLYLMLVVIMFSILLLTITCYFHESSLF